MSDIAMPDEDGYALIASLRRIVRRGDRRVPAIAVTALARDEDRQRALVAGYDVCLTKPIAPEELVQAVSTVAEHQRH